MPFTLLTPLTFVDVLPLRAPLLVAVSFLEGGVLDLREGTLESVDFAERAKERMDDVSGSRGVDVGIDPFRTLPLGREDSPDVRLFPFVIGNETEDCVLGDNNSGVELRVLVSNSGLRCGVEICDGMGVEGLE